MLTELLSHETKYDYYWCFALKVVSRATSGIGTTLLALLAFLALKSSPVPNQSTLLLASLLLICVGFYTSELYSEKKRKQEWLITKLKHHAVVVGPALLLMHHEQTGEVIDAASQVLKAHLSMLREEDLAIVDTRQRASLCFLLRSEDPELVLAAISALKYVGDERAIGPLQAMLGGKSVSSAMREAIESSMIEISERSAARNHAQTLLRSGTSPVVPASLLRSSCKNLDSGVDQLVRAIK
jgi:hypothetical protein